MDIDFFIDLDYNQIKKQLVLQFDIVMVFVMIDRFLECLLGGEKLCSRRIFLVLLLRFFRLLFYRGYPRIKCSHRQMLGLPS
jgi:hypothetical protein